MNTATKAYHRIEDKMSEIKRQTGQMNDLMRLMNIPEIKGFAAIDAGVIANRLRILADDFDALVTDKETEHAQHQ